jgi:hypothetical protein
LRRQRIRRSIRIAVPGTARSPQVEPNEALAVELERSAARAQARGGLVAGAAFLERAALATPDAARRTVRLLSAAAASFEAGVPDSAHELIVRAASGPVDELQRARMDRLRAQIVFARERGSDAPRLLLDVAKRLDPLDAGLARDTYLEAIGAAIFAGRLGLGAREATNAAVAAPPAPQPPRRGDPAAELEELPPGAPRYVVSATLRKTSSRERTASGVRSH